MSKQVTVDVWKERMNNLIERRTKGIISSSNPAIGDYKAHLKMIEVGKTVLDVGAGSGNLKWCLPEGTHYWGIDPFPQIPTVLEATIEDFECNRTFETVVMFAALDNVIDFKKALDKIKKLATKNVYFLTGVGIEPDKYHTIKVTEQDLILEMKPFKIGYMNYLAPKVLLIEFRK